MELIAQQQEALLGSNHPVVGKRWLSLSKAYQEKDPAIYAARAENALIRSSSQRIVYQLLLIPIKFADDEESMYSVAVPRCQL